VYLVALLTSKTVHVRQMNLNETENRVVVPVSGYTSATVSTPSTWTTAVITLRRGNIISKGADLETGVTIVAGSSGRQSVEFSVSGFAFLFIDLTTVAGSSQYADFYVHLAS
jgi:hypothetical protein